MFWFTDLDTALGSFSLDCLQKSVEIANTGLLDISDDHAHETSLLADCHYRLAQFCYDVLEKQPLGEVRSVTNVTSYSTDTSSLFRP